MYIRLVGALQIGKKSICCTVLELESPKLACRLLLTYSPDFNKSIEHVISGYNGFVKCM